MREFKLKATTKEEFDTFLDEYGKDKLISHIYFISEPTQIHYCDFKLGVWPECVVAIYSPSGYGSKTNNPYDGKEAGGWKIRA